MRNGGKNLHFAAGGPVGLQHHPDGNLLPVPVPERTFAGPEALPAGCRQNLLAKLAVRPLRMHVGNLEAAEVLVFSNPHHSAPAPIDVENLAVPRVGIAHEIRGGFQDGDQPGVDGFRLLPLGDVADDELHGGFPAVEDGRGTDLHRDDGSIQAHVTNLGRVSARFSRQPAPQAVHSGGVIVGMDNLLEGPAQDFVLGLRAGLA